MKTVSEVMEEKAVIEARVSALSKVSCEARKQLSKDDKAVLAVILEEEQAKLEAYLATPLTINNEVE